MKPDTRGYVVTKTAAISFLIAFIGSLITVGVLVYFLADRPFPPADGNSSSSGQPSKSQPPPATAQSSKTVSGKDVRLPRHVLPRHYDVRLFPVIERGNFSIVGRVSIDVECVDETDKIVLHSAEIAVDARTVQVVDNANNKTLAVEGIDYDTDMEFLVVKLGRGKLMGRHNYSLSMDFVGNLTDQLRGLYRSSYKENGIEKFLAVSQMEPTDARRAFPCFDEPNMKATFSVTLGRHRNMTALSNMPLIQTTPMDGMDAFFWDEFEKSVPMSTYLVAFLVADFAKVSADVNGAKWHFNIYARQSAQNQTQYASEIGPRIQTFLEDYFQIPFPLPKQDMIAIPDFAAGAMENWGMITYRETALLYEDKKSSIKSKERVLEVIAHELAHQWFGNLVTMDWWTDLWLNEGFASYVEYLGADHVEPTFKWLEQFVAKDLQDVMSLDSLESSHPISVVVQNPNEINEIFDRISYGKGATIIRMLNHFIGEKSFRQGLTNYLLSRKYGNAVQDDLWQAFTEQAKEDNVPLPTGVKEIMDTWTLKMGFPVVTVTRDYPSRSVSLSQERFLMQQKTTEDKTVYLWWVPLTYTADFQQVGSTWLTDEQSSKNHSLDFDVAEDQWLIFNVNQTGYFRVNYDQHNWQLLTKQLMKDHTAISVINRAQIMDDALNLAQAGLLDYAVALDLTRYLDRETEYLPWESTLTSLNYIKSMMSRSSGYGFLKKHINKIINPLYSSLGFNPRDSDAPLTTKLRADAVGWACSMGNKNCVNNAIRVYSQWMADPENPESISPDIKSTTVCTAIREGGDEEWNFAFSQYAKSNLASEQAVLLSAMSCSRQPWILAKMLEMSLNSTSGIRKQDASRVITQVAGNPLGRYMAFNFIRNRWDDLRKSFVSFSSLSRVIQSVAGSLNTEFELKELLTFHEENKASLANAARSTKQSIDRAKNNLKWMNKNYNKVVEWLERNYA